MDGCGYGFSAGFGLALIIILFTLFVIFGTYAWVSKIISCATNFPQTYGTYPR